MACLPDLVRMGMHHQEHRAGDFEGGGGREPAPAAPDGLPKDWCRSARLPLSRARD